MSYNGSTITYDTIGNPLTDGTWNYTWKQGRQLAQMSNGTTTWAYTYDDAGLRTQRTDGEKIYSYGYSGGQLRTMTVSSGSSTDYYTFRYGPDGHPYSVRVNATDYFYLTNLQGDVTGIRDKNGTTVVSYIYDAWGNIVSTLGSEASTLGEANPLRYRGYVYDQETGLYYLQSRYYNPQWGRFINADSFAATGQGLTGNNMFAYCNNNPVNYLDPSGNISIFAIIGFVALGVAAVAIDHYVAKHAPGGVALYENPQTGEKWIYVEGHGFTADANGIVLCDSELGLAALKYGSEDGNLEFNIIKLFSASAVAELDWSGYVPALDISAVAAMYTADYEYTASIFGVKITVSAALHVGGAGVGIEFDPEEMKIKATPPATGVIPSFGIDIDF